MYYYLLLLLNYNNLKSKLIHITIILLNCKVFKKNYNIKNNNAFVLLPLVKMGGGGGDLYAFRMEF